MPSQFFIFICTFSQNGRLCELSNYFSENMTQFENGNKGTAYSFQKRDKNIKNGNEAFLKRLQLLCSRPFSKIFRTNACNFSLLSAFFLIKIRIKIFEHAMMSSAYALNDDIKCIDTSAFLCEMTLRNKNCFWSLLQSQTDKMHYYYQDQVQSILHKFEDHHKVRRKYRTSYVISSLQRAKLSTEHLKTFLQSSFRDFKLVVKKFDE